MFFNSVVAVTKIQWFVVMASSKNSSYLMDFNITFDFRWVDTSFRSFKPFSWPILVRWLDLISLYAVYDFFWLGKIAVQKPQDVYHVILQHKCQCNGGWTDHLKACQTIFSYAFKILNWSMFSFVFAWSIFLNHGLNYGQQKLPVMVYWINTIWSVLPCAKSSPTLNHLKV